MSTLSRPTLCRNESMQKYLLLTAQKEALQRRVALQLPFGTPREPSSPEFQSLSSSPDWSPKYTTPYPAATEPLPTTTVRSSRSSMDDMHMDESHKLAEINQQIIATLTELLNTESIRSDEKSRAWIQEKLMEAEHQIRRQRRRHSSNSERDFASAIAHHLELDLNASKTWA
ncbi:hypothetical protein HBI17_203460 [Parastagonospora nodorum]|nr:hypothetical protein HBI17_203460 [Parastagonospora nodorum]